MSSSCTKNVVLSSRNVDDVCCCRRSYSLKSNVMKLVELCEREKTKLLNFLFHTNFFLAKIDIFFAFFFSLSCWFFSFEVFRRPRKNRKVTFYLCCAWQYSALSNLNSIEVRTSCRSRTISIYLFMSDESGAVNFAVLFLCTLALLSLFNFFARITNNF